MSPSSLLRLPGGYDPELLVRQAEHLIRLMTAHRQVTVRLLPFTANVAFVESDFEILHFTDDTPGFAYVEFSGGGRTFKSPSSLAAFEADWRTLTASALSRDESIEYLAAMAEKSEDAHDAQFALDRLMFVGHRLAGSGGGSR